MMLKTVVWILAIALLVVLVMNAFFWGSTKEKIAKAEQDLKEYKEMYGSAVHKADSLDVIVDKLQERGEYYEIEIDSLQGIVDSLEMVSEQEVIRVANLFQPNELVEGFKATFPEYKDTPIGFAKVPHPETGFEISTIHMPVQVLSTFISDHIDVELFRKQKKFLGEEILTYENYIALKDSIITLKEEKAAEYKKGLDYGLNMYQELTEEYIATLKKPPKIGLPSLSTILTSGALGVAAGVAIAKD